MEITTNAVIKSFGGQILKITHSSSVLSCKMDLNVFLPSKAADDKAETGSKVPCLLYLAGLTCSGNNGLEKGGFLPFAARENIAIVFPDTSPRGLNLPGEDDSWDFGSGAGFYINATAEPWSKNYRMEEYVTQEIPQLLSRNFKQLDLTKLGVFGHSMGGHGALTLYFKHPNIFNSVSAFSPICNPVNCPWGQKAFGNYFGSQSNTLGKKSDATELAKEYSGKNVKILIDVGTGDQFYKDKQLLPENLARSAESNPSIDLQVNYREGYDHSYFFISTFAEDHIKHHSDILNSL